MILSEGKQDVYNAIVFIDQDDGHHITKMTISRNSRYHFQIDEPIAVSDAKVIATMAKRQEQLRSNPLAGMGMGRQQERMGTLKETNVLPERDQRKEYRYGYSSCKRNH